MLACLDVDYTAERTCAACVVFDDWLSAEPSAEHVVRLDAVDAEDYEPGEFYKRELPPLLAVLQKVDLGHLEALLVDSYVWLDHERPGMGKHLHSALGAALPVVGIAKNAFAGNRAAIAVERGESHKPLFVTAEGCDLAVASEHVRSMHGEYRVPTLLRRVDQLCRRG